MVVCVCVDVVVRSIYCISESSQAAVSFQRNGMNKETSIHRRTHTVFYFIQFFFLLLLLVLLFKVVVVLVVASSLLHMPFVCLAAYLRLNKCYRHRQCSTLVLLFSEHTNALTHTFRTHSAIYTHRERYSASLANTPNRVCPSRPIHTSEQTEMNGVHTFVSLVFELSKRAIDICRRNVAQTS